MTIDPQLLAFIGVASVLTVTPGADMALVTRSALVHGFRAAWWTGLGVCTGLLVWGVLSAVGLSALLKASAVAYTTLKIAGAAYLVWLGVAALRQSRRRAGTGAVSSGRDAVGAGQAYRQGLLSNLLNPKIGVFYTTFLPQFIADGQSVLGRSLLLTSLHFGIGLAWLSAYGLAVCRAGDVLRRPAVRRALDRFTGAVLIGFGVRLAATR